jgi:hypothetical protein
MKCVLLFSITCSQIPGHRSPSSLVCVHPQFGMCFMSILVRFLEFWRMCALDGVIFQYIYACPDRCGELHYSERFLILYFHPEDGGSKLL